MKSAIFSAGLGDAIKSIYTKAGFRYLSESNEKVAVIVASHNPFTIEIFRHHRNAKNFVLYDLGHKYEEFLQSGLRDGDIGKALYEFAGLPIEAQVRGPSEGYIPVFDAPDDISSEGHVIFCPFAGSIGERTFTHAFIKKTIEVLKKLPVPVYLVTRSFPRAAKNGRMIHAEEDARCYEGGNIQVLDNLTVPASLNLVRNSCAYVGSWSSLHQASWFENKPVAVFYPPNWCDVVNRTGYAFGLDRKDCLHADFKAADMNQLNDWLQMWTNSFQHETDIGESSRLPKL